VLDDTVLGEWTGFHATVQIHCIDLMTPSTDHTQTHTHDTVLDLMTPSTDHTQTHTHDTVLDLMTPSTDTHT